MFVHILIYYVVKFPCFTLNVYVSNILGRLFEFWNFVTRNLVRTLHISRKTLSLNNFWQTRLRKILEYYMLVFSTNFLPKMCRLFGVYARVEKNISKAVKSGRKKLFFLIRIIS